MKMKKILVVAVTVIAGLAVGLAGAEDEKKGKPEKGKGKGDPAQRAEMMLKKLDTDKSGTISKEEFAAGPMAERLKGKEGALVGKTFVKMPSGETTNEKLTSNRNDGDPLV